MGVATIAPDDLATLTVRAPGALEFIGEIAGIGSGKT
jgi:hypothetical protein